MTYQADCTLPTELLEQVAEQGLDILPELIRIVINNAMQVERQKYLGIGPYERSDERQGHANGFKPKTVSTRVARSPSTSLRFVKVASTHKHWRRGCEVSVH